MIPKKQKKIISFVILSLLSVIVIAIGLVIGSYWMIESRIQKEDAARKAMYAKILDGVSVSPANITITYDNPIAKGSPYIFGGSHVPPAEDIAVWDKLKSVGVTAVRNDFYTADVFPPGVTLESYKNNVDDIQNSDNWKWDTIRKVKGGYENAHKRGMKVIGLASYAPAWLTHNNSRFGVPLDWAVYEDIVGKLYTIYRDDVDYVEIWNEPNYELYLKPDGSGLTREQAYTQIYYHAAKAIREVDANFNDGKRVPLGGPVGYEPTKTQTLDALLKDPRTRDNVDFVSYHNYEHVAEPSWDAYKKVMKENNKEHLPIFLTEWNASLKGPEKEKKYLAEEAFFFTAEKFMNYLRMGLEMANYHSLDGLNEQNKTFDGNSLGFYRKNSKEELLPQSKSWQLLSADMGLGKGYSRIYNAKQTLPTMDSLGFINALGQRGAVILNASSEAHMTTLTLKETGIKKYAKVAIYYASASNTGKSPVYEGDIKTDKEGLLMMVYVPQETVVGVVVTEEKEWFDFLNIGN